MHLYAVPLIFVLVGLVLYAVLAGADFGAGFWQLLAGPGERGAPIRDHAHEAMAPVWEANHVWLIFVLTVTWTAYPSAFGAIASTLCVPLFIAALGIVMRGAAYALRAGASSVREQDRVDLVFALSSVLTPFALGTVVGAVAARSVPLGNAAGGLFSSWTGATPLLVGALAVANSAYVAAVFLAADAKRTGRRRELQEALRRRALIAGLIAGALALAGLVVIHADAHFLCAKLLSGGALAAVILSALAGLGTLGLVAARSYEPARYSAALAVAAVIAGWALAQQPVLLKGLTVQQAAAPHDTLVLVVVAVLAGGLLLFPSLALLFRLVLRGRLDHGPAPNAAGDAPRAYASLTGLISASASNLLARVAGALLLTGFATLTVAEAGWAHAIGICALLGFMVTGFFAIVPAQLAELDGE
jgi:cytochrome bd ubiquinol oxidase subunit II